MSGREIAAAAVLAAVGLGAAGCAEFQGLVAEKPISPVACQDGPDCVAKWSRAVDWVSQNAGARIQVQNDSVIKTFSTRDKKIEVIVNKTATTSGQFEIGAKISCENPKGCSPDAHDALRSFLAFVNG
jgi:hypothetical protein